ncbi:MAG: 23S rRNA G2069 N7-methylase RlmK/C1962 C5-methylase RlmI [Candidatus Krumholzibacteriia bacterium]
MILFEDSQWLVVNKPTGLATHAGKPGELGAVEWLALHVEQKVHVVSRLDRGTSGVLVFAKNAAASARAQAIHEASEGLKTYRFISTVDSNKLGLPTTWERDDELDGKSARTTFTRLAASDDDRFVHYQAEISRGRKHQIRRHAQSSGVSLLGDDQYGGAVFSRLCLHCAQVSWPGISEPLIAAEPQAFTALLKATAGDAELAVCFDRRGEWLQSITDAFRVVHRDEIPGLPAAVDVYGSWFNAVWFDETATANEQDKLLQPVLTAISQQYGCLGGVVRTHRRNPHQRSLVKEVTVVGETPPEVFTVTEHGLAYEINLLKTQHTGLFLDQRDSRRRTADVAKNARVANLFAFTCSFSLVTAQHGAEVVFSIDTAKPCLTTGKTNFSLNGLNESGQGKFVQEDVRKWLGRQLRKAKKEGDDWTGYQLIVCDPPVFASSKDGGKFSVADEWAGLASSCAQLLTPGGVAVFANNHRTGDHKYYHDSLCSVFDEVLELRPPLDFPIFPGRRHYVRTFWCQSSDSSNSMGLISGK